MLWRRTKRGLLGNAIDIADLDRLHDRRRQPRTRRRDRRGDARAQERHQAGRRARPTSRDVSLKLERGTLNVLLGPTLSGKTSLMRLMAGLDKPTSGSVWFDGVDVTGVAPQKRNIAMVFQQFINYPSMTVYENIASPLRVAGADRAEIDAKVQQAADADEARALSRAHAARAFPAASSSAPRWPAPSSRMRGSCCSTSRWPTSTTSCARSCAPNCRASSPRAGSIFVYATTEPSEALLLGGNTATLSEGRVTQFGPTHRGVPRARRPAHGADVLRSAAQHHRAAASAARRSCSMVALVFRFPPILPALPTATYTIGFQPHHLSLTRPSAEAVAVPARGAGDRDHRLGELRPPASLPMRAGSCWRRASTISRPTRTIEVFLDPRHLMVFDRRAARSPPSSSVAA